MVKETTEVWYISPMDAQTAIYFLADYLDIPSDTIPENVEQTNTYIVRNTRKR